MAQIKGCVFALKYPLIVCGSPVLRIMGRVLVRSQQLGLDTFASGVKASSLDCYESLHRALRFNTVTYVAITKFTDMQS